jgi:DsbC/DsbD-like thiol-disulfide interchange protein
MRLRGFLRVLFAVAAFGVVAPAQSAAPVAPLDPVKAKLVPELRAVAPGTTLWVDLHLDIEPGWHTYWRNPGDSGLPTEIAWTLPPGFAAGDIVWPVPERFVASGIGNYGYSRAVDLLSRADRSTAAARTRAARIEANASWLVCSEICIPGEAKLSLAHCRSAPARHRPTPAQPALFAAARKRVPKPAASPRLAAVGKEIRLTVPATASTGLDQSERHVLSGRGQHRRCRRRAENRAPRRRASMCCCNGQTARPRRADKLDGVLVCAARTAAPSAPIRSRQPRRRAAGPRATPR